jgi:hypothetical protein
MKGCWRFFSVLCWRKTTKDSGGDYDSMALSQEGQVAI